MRYERVAYFYAKARECIRMARICARGNRDYFIWLAGSWRDLARQTRARLQR